MEFPKALTISVEKSSTSTHQPPMVNMTVVKDVGRELVFELPWGERVSLSKEDLYCLCGRGLSKRITNQEELVRFHRAISELASRGSGALIPVRVASTANTGKSKRVRVDGVMHKQSHQGSDFSSKSHTVTVPAVTVQVHEGNNFLPRWVLNRAIHENVLGGTAWPSHIKGGCWLGADRMWHQLFAPLASELVHLQTEQAKLSAIRAVERERRAEEERARAVIDRARAEEAKIAWAAAEKRSAERKAKLETLHVTNVEWDDWEKRRGGRFVKVTNKATNCTLRFSGERIYIELEDGHEIIKTRATVRWQLASVSAQAVGAE